MISGLIQYDSLGRKPQGFHKNLAELIEFSKGSGYIVITWKSVAFYTPTINNPKRKLQKQFYL
jgi:hypothetical protein